MNVKKIKGFKLKNTARRTASLLLAAIMILGILPAQAPKAQAESWVDPYLNKLAEWGVMKGDQDGNMNPDRNITRAEFVAMINRAYGYKTVASTPFTDVYIRNWYYDDIGIAYGAGYFNGTSATTASPERTLTREEAAVVMARNMRLQPVVGEATSFNDGRYFSSWSRGLIESAARHNVISGYPDGSFQPFRNITRGEMAALVARAVGTLIKDPGVHTLGSVGGNVTVTTSGVTLRDTVIAGDLYLTGGVGLGSVTLDNVTVLGKIIISGAGEANAGDSSVIIRNTRAEQMVVDSIVNQFVTIRAEGDTLINKTTVRTQAYIEDVSPSNRGLPNIEIDGERGLKVQLAGNIKDVINLTPDSTLTLAQGRANVVTIDEEATGSTLHIELGSTINTLNLDVGTTVTGKGDVGHLNVNAAGCTVEMLPDTITIRPGITANIYGEVMDSAAAIESSSSPRILAGYPAVRDVAPNSASAVFSTNKRGTLYWAISSISDGSVSEDDLINPPVYGGNIIQSGHMEMPSSNTEVPIPLTNLITDGSYYVSAVLVDNRDKRSPVKVAAFTTPDNTVPAFSVNPTVTVNKENDAWATVLPSKSCQLYYAVLPQGAVAPTIDEFKTGSVSGNLGYGVRSVIKNVTDTFQVNTADLDELKDYVLYLLLIDADGAMNSGVTSVPFRTLDITPPQFVIEAQATGIRERAVDVNTTINENGTIFWVVVNSGQNYPVALPGQNEVPSLTSESAKMQVENAMGNVRASGRVTATANRDTRITISQNLEPATAYDLYYVAKDTAGNYSYEVKKLTINTLDNVPPTVSQRFTSTVDEAGTQPLSTSDIEIVFSESVMDNDRNSGDSFIQLYEKINNSAFTEAERTAARNTLTEQLHRDIILMDNNRTPEDRVPDKEDVASGAWIDYSKAKVEMRDGQTVIIFENSEAISLASGGSYHFQIRNICDVSNNRNNMTPNPTNLTVFTIAFAQVTLTQGITSTPMDIVDSTKAIDIDMGFTMTPLSTNSVEDSVAYDMFLWADKTVGFDLYVRVLREDGTAVKKGESNFTETDGTAMSMFGDSDAFGTRVDAGGWFCLGNMLIYGQTDQGRQGNSVKNIINNSNNITSAFPKLKTLNEKYKYEFAISITQLGTSHNRDEWNDRVNIWVTVPAGPEYAIRLLANEIVSIGALESWNNAIETGGVLSSIGYGINGEDDFKVEARFVDSSVPRISNNFPYVEAGDQTAVLKLMLSRPGTVYYIVAPVDGENDDKMPVFQTVFNDNQDSGATGKYKYSDLTVIDDTRKGTDNRVIRPNEAEIIRSQSMVTTPIELGVYQYVTTTTPTETNRVKFGTASVGISETPITIRGLEPTKEYMVYLVVRGTSQALSKVHCFRFSTVEANVPVITLVNNSPTVNVSTSENANVEWIMYSSSQIRLTMMGNPLKNYITDAALLKKLQDRFSQEFPGTTKTWETVTVMDALLATDEESGSVTQGRSLFDKYAGGSAKNELREYIRGQRSGNGEYTDLGELETTRNTSEPVSPSGMSPNTQYYFIADAKNSLGEVYAFRALDNVRLPDRNPPEVSNFVQVVDPLASNIVSGKGTYNIPKKEVGANPGWEQNPENYMYKGQFTLTFTEPIYQVEINPQTQETTTTAITQANLQGKLISYGVEITQVAVSSGQTVTITYENATNGAYITFFGSGTIGDMFGNTHEGAQMVLRFSVVSGQIVTVADPNFSYQWQTT